VGVRGDNIFKKLANKNAIKAQKGIPSQNIFTTSWTLPPKKCQKPHRPSPWIFNSCAFIDGRIREKNQYE
jgi:hypothetical protein